MEGVGGRAVADQLGQGSAPRAAARLGLLEHQHARALAHHEPVAAAVERAADAELGGRAHRREGGLGDRVTRRLGAAGDDRVGLAVLDHPHRRADRVGARGARRDDAVGLAADP